MSDAKHTPVAPSKQPDAVETPGRRVPAPLVLMPVMCTERDCRSMATWLPVVVIRPLRQLEIESPERSYEARSAMPSTTLCGAHARELQLHPQRLFSAEGWEKIEFAYKHNGRLPPDVTRLAIELEALPDPEKHAARCIAIREHARRFESVTQDGKKAFEEAPS